MDLISVGHFTHKNGKIIADPEMHFWYGHKDGLYYPCYYRHDSLKIEQESMFVFGGVIKSTNLNLQHEHAEIAEQWIKRIKEQQKL